MTQITIDRSVVQQGLEALEAMQSYAAAERKGLRICDVAITTLRAALAQQAEPVEPVPQPGAWMHPWPPVRAQQAEPVEPEK